MGAYNDSLCLSSYYFFNGHWKVAQVCVNHFHYYIDNRGDKAAWRCRSESSLGLDWRKCLLLVHEPIGER